MPRLIHLPLCCTKCAAQCGYRGALLRGMLLACCFDNLNSFEELLTVLLHCDKQAIQLLLS